MSNKSYIPSFSKPSFGMVKHKSLTNKLDVVLVGNINGHIADFADDIVKGYNNTLFICTGNFMLGRMNPRQMDLELGYLEGICSKNDNIVATIRGELDNPYYFIQEKFRELNKGLFDYLQHVIFLEDYTVVSTRVGDFLCIGGKTTNEIDICLDKHVDPMTNPDDVPSYRFTWKGSGVNVIDTKPIIEESITEDGEKIEIDINPFNNDIKGYKVSRLITNAVPTFAGTDNISDTDQVALERMALSLFWSSLQKNLGIYIKFWYCSSDDFDSNLCDGTTFVALKTMKKETV